MPIESIQCPQCGSPLQVEPGAEAATCTYCGSRLRITGGVSGHPLGKVDTEIIAKQTAIINHLRERLRELAEEREKLKAQKRSELEALGLLRPDVGGRAGHLLSLAAALRTRKPLEAEAQRKVEEKYGRAIARADEQIQSTQRRIAELQADMDRLAREV